MLLLNLKRLAWNNALLGAAAGTCAAADAVICDPIALRHCAADIPDGVTFPKNGANSEMKIFNPGLSDGKDNPDFSRLSGIHIGQIVLLKKK